MSDVWELVLAQAGKQLAVRLPGQMEPNRYALDRANRLIRVAGAIAAATPEAERPGRVDLVKIAAIYASLPWRDRQARGSDDDAAELAADQLKERLPAKDLELVLRILREYRQRNSALGEAWLLSDAIALEDIGLVGLWNQTRMFHAAGKTLEQILKLWKTQLEYGYWETRLREGLHFAVTRAAAQRRLDALHTIFDRMARENAGSDIG